jgi:putative heme-binding domain-containing protein
MLPSARQQSIAGEILVPAISESLQLPVIDSLLWSDPNAASQLLIDRFQNLTPDLQRAVLGGLMRYPSTLPALASAIKSKKVLPSQIPPDTRVRLLAANDKDLGKQFVELLNSVSADRAAIIQQYTPALSGGDAEAGKQVFSRVCAQCHRLSDMGNDVGPPLKQLTDKSPQQLLETILDPNREVDPKYASYSVLLQDGRVYAGIIAEEAASQIVIAEAGGKKHTIPRSDIDQLRSTGVSLMPNGLEQQITPEQMSQLINFLKNAGHK